MEFLSRSWKVMEFDVGKYVCSGELPTVLDCPKLMRENMLNYDKI